MQHMPKFYIQFTFSDVLCNPKMKFDELELKEGKVTAAMVASAHCVDNQYGSTLLRKASEASIHLTFSVIKLI